MMFPKRETENKLFLKLKDGEDIKGVCRGHVYEFFVKWENNKSLVVEGSDPDARSRYRINFVTNIDGKFVAKVWEFSQTICNKLADLAEEYDLSKTKIKIKRSGTGTDTDYSIIPLLKEPIPDKIMKEIEEVELQVLNIKPEKRELKNHAPGADDHDEVPF